MMPGTRLALALFVATGFAQAQGPQLESIGPIAFGPNSTLLVSDPAAATIYAFDLSGRNSSAIELHQTVENLTEKIGAMLGTAANQVAIVDVAANPATKEIFLAVTRGTGPDAQPLIMTVGEGGAISVVSLEDVEFTKTSLANAPAELQPQSRRQPSRMESITDMAYVDGRVVIAGLSNEEFSSKLRAVPYPFQAADAGTSVEIWHAAHGSFETHSPVRTFVAYEIENVEHLLAAYTCTPLVAFPVSDLEPGKKVMGKTIAELGNRNRPLDMIVYEQEGADYLLLANNARGVMKINMTNAANADGLTERVSGGGSAGMDYETIEALEGVMQLDKLDDGHVVILVQNASGWTLKTLDLP